MEIKAVQLIPLGMNQDLSISKFNPELSYENKNVRIIARDGNSSLSIENEKGNLEVTLPMTLSGVCIGYVTLNKYLILFTTTSTSTTPGTDRIYKITNLGNPVVTKLYEGFLNFSLTNPIEAISFYETEDVQKVYWVDGLNQPRLMNIMKVYSDDGLSTFDFSPTLALNEEVSVTKSLYGGEFQSGTIQYAFTYFNLFSPETNIATYTDLQYISPDDRALAPDQLSTNSFKIEVENLDPNFNYMRCYSIHRNSWNGVPTVKLLGNFDITGKVDLGESLIVVDSGNTGAVIDPTTLITLGGEDLVIGTIAAKDNTLFGGNVKVKRPVVLSGLGQYINPTTQFQWKHRSALNIEEEGFAVSDIYTYKPKSLMYQSGAYRHFKSHQTYRFGIQAQYKNGKWSEPIYLGKDLKCNLPYYTKLDPVTKSVKVELVYGEFTPSTELITNLYNQGFRRIRPVMVMPTRNDREVLAQGILTNTLAVMKNRLANSPFANSDYLARPGLINRNYAKAIPENLYYQPTDGTPLNILKYSQGRYNGYLASGHYNFLFGEVLGSDPLEPTGDATILEPAYYLDPLAMFLMAADAKSYYDTLLAAQKSAFHDKADNFILIDENVVNLWSPELEFGEDISDLLNESTTCQLIGIANITSKTYTHLYADTTSNTYNSSGPLGGPSWSEYNISPYKNYTTWVQPESGYDATLKRNDIYKNIMGFAEIPVGFAIDDSLPVVKRRKMWSFNFYRKYNSSGEILSQFDLTNNAVGTKLYALYNTNFVEDNALSLPIYKPAYVAPVETSNIIPYNTDPSDFNGLIHYQNGMDEVLIYPDINLNGTHIQYKNNGHVVFSLKSKSLLNETAEAEDFSLVLPGLVTTVPDPTKGISIIDQGVIAAPDGSVPTTARVGIKVSNQAGMGTDILSFMYNISVLYREDQFMDPEELLNDTSFLLGIDEAGTPATFSATTPVDADGYAWYTFTKQLPAYDRLVRPLGIFDFSCTPTENKSNYKIGIDKYTTNNVFYGKTDLIWKARNLRYAKMQLSLPSLVVPDKTSYDLYPYFYIAELRRNINPNLLYGGNTDQALQNNVWIPCGESNKLIKTGEVVTTGVLKYVKGDTYFGRYDALRTYNESESNVHKHSNVVSFLCESFINMDGRYDRNRYFSDVSTVRKTNFNLMNYAYSQDNNYFAYNILNPELFTSEYFSNQIVWSKTKFSSEIVDTWASLNLSSSIELDGTLGAVSSLKTYNSLLYAFQDRGIANINFNTRTLVPTSDGQPIELTNNYKVSGYRYLTNQYGTSNKWSIKETKSGIYFIDNLNKAIVRFSGEQVQDLSTEYGFRAWSNNNITNNNALTLNAGGGFSSFSVSYDRPNGDIFVTNATSSLAYSEILGKFSSFYSYENTPFMFNLEDDFVAVRSQLVGGVPVTKLYLQHHGPYNNFFGTKQPTYIHYLINPEPHLDKTFNNLEYIGDVFDMENSGAYLPSRTFNTIKTWNEYQNSGDVAMSLYNNVYKKFRTWRVEIPRHSGSLDRMRNPWLNLKITLTPTTNENIKLSLHNMLVKYTV